MSSSSSTNDDDVDDIIKRFLEHHYPNVVRRARGTIAAAAKHDSLAKDFYFNCRRFDTRQSTNTDLQYLRALFGDVRLYCRGMNRFSDAVYPDFDANTICINDRQFAILAHVALQQRPAAFAELSRPEKDVVVLTEDIRVVASSSRGMERTMLLRDALEIFAGQWIVRANSAAGDDSWFGLTRNGIEIHSLEDWIDITHDRTLAELLFSRNRQYDLFQIEASIGKWASFVKIREGDDDVMQFLNRNFSEREFLDNFAAVAPEKQFLGCLAYLRDEAHYLNDVLFRCNAVLQVRPHIKYTEIADTRFKSEQQHPIATAAESTADARAEDNDKEQNGRPAAQKDFGVMTEAEAKRQECRNRLRARLQRRKKKTL